MWFTDDGAWYDLKEEIESRESRVESRGSDEWFDLMGRFREPEPIEYIRVILKQEFVDANSVTPIGRETLRYFSNFFYGNDTSKWCTEVPNYQEIYYENIYDGIDLRYYTNENGLKYDLIVHPGADVNQIRIRWNGAEKLLIDGSENLIIKTQIENIIDGGLYIYQDHGGSQNPIKGKFVIYNELEYGFELLDNYNKFEDLIIDPYIYSTYVGGIEADMGLRISIDSAGNAIVAGSTSSINFPNTTGVFDRSYNGESDVMVFKLNQDCTALLYSTFIGGTKEEQGDSLAIDSNGNVYISGITESTDFPTTTSTFDTSFNGGVYDIFVCKLNHNGSSLNYSTYIGGDNMEWYPDIDVDPTGCVFVKGTTNSPDFPNTTGAFDTTFSGESDAYVLKLKVNGSGLIYSTFIGGSGSETNDYVGFTGGIEIDSAGNTYITGRTNSPDFPTTDGAYDTTLNGQSDVYVLKLNWNGTKIIYSTLIGGSSADVGIDILIDNNGTAYVSVLTNSTDFPTTPGANDSSFNGGYSDILIFKMNSNGSALFYSTYLGGDGFDTCSSIVLDSSGCVIVTGYITSTDFPITSNAFYSTHNFEIDSYVLRLNQNGSKLYFSTFFGGSSDTRGFAIAVDLSGNVYVTGDYYSSDFPTTPGAFDISFNGGLTDCFVVKFLIPSYVAFTIQSVSLLQNSTLTDTAYSRYETYTLRVEVVNTEGLSDLKSVSLSLDSFGKNLKLLFDPTTSQFSVLNDPNNYISLNSSSNYYFYDPLWIIDFNITFNWNYPDENFNDIQAIAVSKTLPSSWFNKTNIFRVENDLVFNGTLTVAGEDNRTITENELVRGGERFNWSGLKVVYENTINIYPLPEEYSVTIWNENGYLGYGPSSPGNNFRLQTLISSETDFNGDTHIINISGIPSECDKTNTTFTVRIDGDNVTFSEPLPDNNKWENTSEVFISVNITDIGGGIVNSSSVMHSISSDNGEAWGAWEPVSDLNNGTSIIVQKFAIFEDGSDNLIKWRAKDSLGNGPIDSDTYRVLVDTQNVSFTNAWPAANQKSPTENVTVGITISDLTSGVNVSTIKYSVSYDAGQTWDDWRSVTGFGNGNEVNVTLNLTFPNGTDNRIKWLAYDIAGNGPVVSDEYIIRINKILPTPPPVKPKVILMSPSNGSIISKTFVELTWELVDTDQTGVTYNVIIGTDLKLIEIREYNLSMTNFMIADLEDGITYYWTIIPKLGIENGSCASGIWSFSIEIIHIRPSITLLFPENGTNVQALKPTFVWSVNYNGTEELTYDIYLGKNNSLVIEVLDYYNTNYLSKNVLEYNETYYWKVVPKAGGHEGFESETWWFTVRPKDYVPTFGIELILEPATIEIRPGETRFINATVTNLGEITDKIVLSIPEVQISGVDIEINEPKIIEVSPNGTAEFNISVRAQDDALENEISIVVVAASSNAAEYNQILEKKTTLTVKILSLEHHDTGSSTDASWYWIIILIIFVIIIVLIIVGLIIKRKQKPKQEPLPVEASTPEPKVEVSQTPEIVPEIVTIAPTTIPTVDTIEVDSLPPIQATPTPIPGQTPLLQMSEVPAQAPTQPQLEATTTMTTPTSQMAQVQPLPQLPPVQIETPQQLPIEPEIIQPQPATETQQQKKPSIEEEVDEKINGQKNN